MSLKNGEIKMGKALKDNLEYSKLSFVLEVILKIGFTDHRR